MEYWVTKNTGNNGSYQWFMVNNYQRSDDNQKMAGTENNG